MSEKEILQIIKRTYTSTLDRYDDRDMRKGEELAKQILSNFESMNYAVTYLNPQTSVIEKIVSVATVYMGNVIVLPRPARHDNVLKFINDNFVVPEGYGVAPEEQGFMTSFGRFVDRVTAKRIAIGADQILPMREGQTTRYVGPDLFSEDVW